MERVAVQFYGLCILPGMCDRALVGEVMLRIRETEGHMMGGLPLKNLSERNV